MSSAYTESMLEWDREHDHISQERELVAEEVLDFQCLRSLAGLNPNEIRNQLRGMAKMGDIPAAAAEIMHSFMDYAIEYGDVLDKKTMIFRDPSEGPQER